MPDGRKQKIEELNKLLKLHGKQLNIPEYRAEIGESEHGLKWLVRASRQWENPPSDLMELLRQLH